MSSNRWFGLFFLINTGVKRFRSFYIFKTIKNYNVFNFVVESLRHKIIDYYECTK